MQLEMARYDSTQRCRGDMIPSFKNKVTTKDAKEDEVYLLHIFASFALFVVASLLSF